MRARRRCCALPGCRQGLLPQLALEALCDAAQQQAFSCDSVSSAFGLYVAFAAYKSEYYKPRHEASVLHAASPKIATGLGQPILRCREIARGTGAARLVGGTSE